MDQEVFLRDKTCVHAEVDAIRNHPDPTRGYCISVRLDRKDRIAFAAPCISCMTILKEYRIKKVIYSDPDSPSGYTVIIL